MNRLSRYVVPCALAVLLAAGVARAQQDSGADYPRKPVRLLIPSAPGGGTDIIARLVSQKVSEAWRQTIVVDNHGGGATTIGTNIVAKASPDGYTLLMTAANFSMIPALYPKLPYDPEKDFIPVLQMATQASLLAINPNVPAKTVAEFIAYAKSRPGELRYGSGGNGTPVHLSTELFRVLANITLAHIPYNGTGPATAAVLTGDVHMIMTNVATLLPLVRSGKLRALAVTGAVRAKAVPELPTIAEAALPGYQFDGWYGLWVPAQTPRAIVHKINEAFNRALAAPDILERFAGPGIEPGGGTPEKFAAYQGEEIRKWTRLVRAAGIRAE